MASSLPFNCGLKLVADDCCSEGDKDWFLDADEESSSSDQDSDASEEEKGFTCPFARHPSQGQTTPFCTEKYKVMLKLKERRLRAARRAQIMQGEEPKKAAELTDEDVLEEMERFYGQLDKEAPTFPLLFKNFKASMLEKLKDMEEKEKVVKMKGLGHLEETVAAVDTKMKLTFSPAEIQMYSVLDPRLNEAKADWLKLPRPYQEWAETHLKSALKTIAVREQAEAEDVTGAGEQSISEDCNKDDPINYAVFDPECWRFMKNVERDAANATTCRKTVIAGFDEVLQTLKYGVIANDRLPASTKTCMSLLSDNFQSKEDILAHVKHLVAVVLGKEEGVAKLLEVCPMVWKTFGAVVNPSLLYHFWRERMRFQPSYLLRSSFSTMRIMHKNCEPNAAGAGAYRLDFQKPFIPTTYKIPYLVGKNFRKDFLETVKTDEQEYAERVEKLRLKHGVEKVKPVTTMQDRLRSAGDSLRTGSLLIGQAIAGSIKGVSPSMFRFVNHTDDHLRVIFREELTSGVQKDLSVQPKRKWELQKDGDLVIGKACNILPGTLAVIDFAARNPNTTDNVPNCCFRSAVTSAVPDPDDSSLMRCYVATLDEGVRMRETENNINFNHPSLCDDFAPTLAIQCSLRFFDKGSLQDKHLNVKDDKSAWRPWEKALFTRELDKNTVLMTFIEKFPRELLDTSKSCGKGRTVKIGNEIFKEHGFYHVHHENSERWAVTAKILTAAGELEEETPDVGQRFSFAWECQQKYVGQRKARPRTPKENIRKSVIPTDLSITGDDNSNDWEWDTDSTTSDTTESDFMQFGEYDDDVVPFTSTPLSLNATATDISSFCCD